MKIKAIIIFLAGIFVFPLSGFSQFTLEEALSKARTHSPLAAVKDYSGMEKDLKLENIRSQYYPQISISGQASYQSEVTTFPLELPGVEIEPLSKDQYRVLGEVNQKLYDGGANNQQKQMATTAFEIEQNGVEVELEKIREQIIELYFNILELDARLRIVALSREDLLASLKIVEAAVANGTALKSEKNTLEAALINLEQQTIELQAVRATLIENMRLLTNAQVDPSSQFVMPVIVPQTISVNPAKYSFQVFDLQQQLLNQNYELSKISSLPMLSLFAQGGYGKPGLNFLKNEWEPYYVLGARATWKFGNLYTKSNDREIMALGIQKISARKETLALQTDISFSNYNIEIEKIQTLTSKDRELLLLRQQITETSKTQLENGVMTSADYLARFNEEKQVQENLSLREVQLRKAQYMLAHIAGNYSH